jgi:hypothetical protein
VNNTEKVVYTRDIHGNKSIRWKIKAFLIIYGTICRIDFDLYFLYIISRLCAFEEREIERHFSSLFCYIYKKKKSYAKKCVNRPRKLFECDSL